MAIIAPDIGIDLGTSNTLVHVRKKGIVISEPTLLVVDGGKKHTIRALGEDARMLIGRTTGDAVTIRPLKDGTVKDFEMTESILRFFIRKAIGASRLIKPRALITVPSRITDLERKAIREAAISAGVRRNALSLVDKPFAAAIGSGLPAFEPKGSMVVDIGGGTTEAAVISLGGIVISHSIHVGGIKMDEAISNYFMREFNMLIGDHTAEEVKIDLGAALPLSDERRATVRGRDMVTNLPQTVEITSSRVYDALKGPCQSILTAIQFVLERTPPELAGDVMRSGIHLTGGGSLLFGIDQFIATELDMPVLLAKEPMSCAAMGIGYLTDNMELLPRMGKSSYLREESN
jgi:rod shape-determining protein MreB and related proteins